MAQQAITINIAGVSIPLTIESGKEEVYRLAEREVSKYFKEIRTNNLQGWTDRHYLVMAALHFAIDSVRQRRRSEIDSDDLRKLDELSTEIDTYLNHPGAYTPGRGGGRQLPPVDGNKTFFNIGRNKIYPHRFLIALRN